MPNGLKRNGSKFISPPPNGWGLSRPQCHTQGESYNQFAELLQKDGLTHHIRVSEETLDKAHRWCQLDMEECRDAPDKVATALRVKRIAHEHNAYD